VRSIRGDILENLLLINLFLEIIYFKKESIIFILIHTKEGIFISTSVVEMISGRIYGVTSVGQKGYNGPKKLHYGGKKAPKKVTKGYRGNEKEGCNERVT